MAQRSPSCTAALCSERGSLWQCMMQRGAERGRVRGEGGGGRIHKVRGERWQKGTPAFICLPHVSDHHTSERPLYSVCVSVCVHACVWKGKAWALMCLNRTNWTLKWKHAWMESATMTSVSECWTVYFFLMSAGLHFPLYIPITSPAGAPCPTGPRGLSGTRSLRTCSTGHQHCSVGSAKCVCECVWACSGGSMSLKK